MRLVPVLTLSLGILSACDSGGRGFAGEPAARQEVGGAVFEIRRRGAHAEALRVSNHVLPRFPWVARRGAVAVARSTGCRPDWIVGDPSVLQVGLACGDEPAPKIPRGPLRLVCEIEGKRNGPGTLAEADLYCTLE